jgi:hypothetical protein
MKLKTKSFEMKWNYGLGFQLPELQKKTRRLKIAKFVYLVSVSSQKLLKNDQRIVLHGWCTARFGLNVP